MSSEQSVELPALYYLDNFLALLNSIEIQYKDLLTPCECQWLKKFRLLKIYEQALLVRLYARRGHLFRSDKVNYPELPALANLLPAIERSGFIQCNPELQTTDLMQLATCKDIRCWWSDELPRGSAGLRKTALVEALTHLETEHYYARVPYTVISVEHQRFIELLLLLFFGQPDQDLSPFITTELGVTKYENYSLSQKDRLFHKRTDIEHALDLMQVRATFHSLKSFDAALGSQLLAQLPAVSADSPAKARHDRLCNRIGRALERCQADELALLSYQKSVLPPARERQARIYYKLGRHEKALALCECMLQQPLSEVEVQFAERFRPRCLKPLGLKPLCLKPLCLKQCADQAGHKTGKRKRFQPVTESISLAGYTHPQRKILRLEIHASQVITETAGGVCYYVENWLFNAVFGLTFWPAIYSKVAGAFTHPFQPGPHDLYAPNFSETRKKTINSAFARIEADSWTDELHHRWHQKFGISNPFVGWNPRGWPIICLALARIPVDHWRIIFQRMLRDLRNNRSGLPDLIHFTEHSGYRLLEVKSPTDKVQANQLRWMQTFDAAKIPYALLQMR